MMPSILSNKNHGIVEVILFSEESEGGLNKGPVNIILQEETDFSDSCGHQRHGREGSSDLLHRG
jgi:hypothetical protein